MADADELIAEMRTRAGVLRRLGYRVRFDLSDTEESILLDATGGGTPSIEAATAMILELCGGTPAGRSFTQTRGWSEVVAPRVVPLRSERVASLVLLPAAATLMRWHFEARTSPSLVVGSEDLPA